MNGTAIGLGIAPTGKAWVNERMTPAEALDRQAATRRIVARVVAAWPAVALAAGGAAWLSGAQAAAGWIWAAGIVPVLLVLLGQIWTSLRRGEVGLDIVALLSMSGALLLGEFLAGNVVALMYAGGELLENFASSRARREMTALLGRVPKTALKYTGAGLAEVESVSLVPGDRVLVRAGDVVAADGLVGSDSALLDQSALTGEAMPVRRRHGQPVLSGSTNAAEAFDLAVTRKAADSAYAAIVRLVEAAQAVKAPMVRLADRYAIWFLVVTVLVAAGAYAASGDPVRALAVLVVATPCPLILAVPVAVVSGVSLAARRGVILKSGGVLENLARVNTVVIDKTGTLTDGRPSVRAIVPAAGFTADTLLALAASVDQASNHVVAGALVSAAIGKGLALQPPDAVREFPGEGVIGDVGGQRVVVGASSLLRSHLEAPTGTSPTPEPGSIVVHVAVDGVEAGHIVLADQIRPEAASTLQRLRARGIDRIVLATGDVTPIAEEVGGQLGVDEIRGTLTPAEKVEAVTAARGHGPVMMIGDGVNDAPALAAADVGVAMAARGSAPSSQAADALLLVDRLDALVDAVDIARRSRRIALQSVYIGLGLSFAGMGFAAFGYLPPVAGALLQEAIDVAVILNALRTLRDRGPERQSSQ